MQTKKKPVANLDLVSWASLNAAVVDITDIKELKALMTEERKGRARKMFLARIQSRINRIQHGRGRGVAKANR